MRLGGPEADAAAGLGPGTDAGVAALLTKGFGTTTAGSAEAKAEAEDEVEEL